MNNILKIKDAKNSVFSISSIKLKLGFRDLER